MVATPFKAHVAPRFAACNAVAMYHAQIASMSPYIGWQAPAKVRPGSKGE